MPKILEIIIYVISKALSPIIKNLFTKYDIIETSRIYDHYVAVAVKRYCVRGKYLILENIILRDIDINVVDNAAKLNSHRDPVRVYGIKKDDTIDLIYIVIRGRVLHV